MNECGTVMYNLVISWLHSSFIIYRCLRLFGCSRMIIPTNNSIADIDVFTKLHVVKKLFTNIA